MKHSMLAFGLVWLGTAALGITPAHADGGAGASACPRHLHDRTAIEVWNDHLAAIQAGDLTLIACDYADDATVVMTGQVISGKANVMAGFVAFANLLGGAIPTVDAVTPADRVLLVEYHLDTTHVTVPDGVDTYVIRDGLIRYQTVHASFQFH